MKKIGFIIMILLSVGSLSAQKRIVASGNAVTKEFIHKPFTAVDVNFIGNVVVRYGNQHKTEITADDNIIEHVKIQVTEGKLSICMDDNISYEKAILRVDITTPHLKELAMRGTCDVRIESRTEPQLTISKSGTGDCIVNCVKVENSMEIHSNGTGDVIIPTDGPLKAKSLLIENSGVGDITINASSINESLTISNLGTSDVKVNLMGIPTEDITLQNKGTGDIRIQNMLGKSVKVKNLGTGDVVLNGKATSHRLVNSGSGLINALSLKAETSHITNYGVGGVKATVTGTAYVNNQSHVGKVNISGGGKVVWE
ncbi:MAG: DUF2807 domain-containing protein [Bacteroidales bacterium]|nr:DUF2807 domain-containing protein [Bacteroidales bacterium]